RLLVVQYFGRALITFHAGLCDERSQWTQLLARFRRPEKAVVGAGRAVQELRVGEHSVPQAILAGIFALRLHIRVADIDRAHFVPANAAGENLLLARCGIEEPLPVLFDEG